MLDWLSRIGPSEPVPMVLYTRRGCGLCEDLEAEILRARLIRPWSLTRVDIEGDAELEDRYGRSIPVLWIAGRLAFKGHVTAGELARKFESLAADWRRARSLEGGLAEARRRSPALPAGALMPSLYVLSGADVGGSFRVGHGATLGRSPDCTVTLRDRSVSRSHAFLECDAAQRWWIVDDGSRNGLSVDGQRVERAELHDGVELAVGELRLRFRVDQDALRAEPAAELAARSRDDAFDVDEIELEPEPASGSPGELEATVLAPRPAAPEPASANRGERRGGSARDRILQYHRVEDRPGWLSSDLAQLPLAVRMLVYVLAAALFAALCWGGFRATTFLRSQAAGEAALEELPP